MEALQGSLEMIETDKVLLEILQGDVGPVTKNDVKWLRLLVLMLLALMLNLKMV